MESVSPCKLFLKFLVWHGQGKIQNLKCNQPAIFGLKPFDCKGIIWLIAELKQKGYNNNIFIAVLKFYL